MVEDDNMFDPEMDFPTHILTEIGSKRLPGLNKVDESFKNLKQSKDKQSDAKLIIALQKILSDIFNTKCEVYIEYVGPGSNNCGIMPYYKRGGDLVKSEDSINLGNIEKLNILVGKDFIHRFEPRELTAVIMHEIGHVVNHGSFALNALRKVAYRSSIVLSTLNSIPIVNAFALPMLIITSRTFYFTNHIGEYDADALATEYGYGDEMIHILRKFGKRREKFKENASLLTKISLFKSTILGHSHPTPEQRISKIATEMKTNYAKLYKSKKIQQLLAQYT